MTAMFKRRLATVGLVMALTLGMLAAPASAQGYDQSCSGGDVCLYKDTYKQGHLAAWPKDDSTLVGNWWPADPNDSLDQDVSSVLNNGFTYDVILYDLPDYGTGQWSPICIAQGDYEPRLSDIDPAANDDLSSYRWIQGYCS